MEKKGSFYCMNKIYKREKTFHIFIEINPCISKFKINKNSDSSFLPNSIARKKLLQSKKLILEN